MISHLNKAKDRVAYLLDKHPSTRDSDKVLWLAYLATFHDLKNQLGEIPYNKFKEILYSENACSMESVRRVRQKYQEDGLFIGTKRSLKLKEETNVREWVK